MCGFRRSVILKQGDIMQLCHVAFFSSLAFLNYAEAQTKASPSASEVARSVAPAQKATGFIALEVKRPKDSGNGWEPINPGSILPSGTKFSLTFEVSAPVFLYIAQRPNAAPLSWILPQAQQEPLSVDPGRLAHFPAAGTWLSLDKRTGPETLFVVATTKKRTRDELAALLEQQPAEVAVDPREPPPLVTERRRGLKGRHVVRVSMPPDGIAILRFGYQHR